MPAPVQENIGAQPLIKVFGLSDLAVRQFQGQITRAARTSIRFGLLGGLLSATVGVGGTSISVLAIGVGASLVIRGAMTVGTLFSFTELLWYVGESLQGVSSVFRPLQQAAAAHARIREILDEPLLVNDAPDAGPLAPFAREIRFADVVFSYNGVDVNLDHGRLHDSAGRLGGLRGPERLRQEHRARVDRAALRSIGRATCLYDGVDIRSVTQASLREQIGMVFQDNFLFNTSLRENIRLGRPERHRRGGRSGGVAAEIHEFIVGLPGGYDTIAGERGGRLSGGQRQRIGIARALLRDPAILLMDEATSALDAGTEAAVNATLARVCRGRTSIAVTHRLSTVRQLDRIFVLERGRIVEQGTHDALLGRGGAYARLWNKQAGMALSDDGLRATIDAAETRDGPDLQRPRRRAAGADRAAVRHRKRARGENRRAAGRSRRSVLCDRPRQGRGVVAAADGAAPRRIAVLQDGDFFGEMALLHERAAQRERPHAGGEHVPHADARAVRRSAGADAQRASGGRGGRRGANLRTTAPCHHSRTLRDRRLQCWPANLRFANRGRRESFVYRTVSGAVPSRIVVHAAVLPARSRPS